MDNLKTKTLLIVYCGLIILHHFTKKSPYDFYISYIQTGILFVSIVLLFKRLIIDYKDKSKSTNDKYYMIINMIVIVILLVMGYFIINSTIQKPKSLALRSVQYYCPTVKNSCL